MSDELIKYLVGDNRFTEIKGYRFDKLIFSGFMLLILVLFMILFVSFGSDRDYHVYYYCPVEFGSCQNPFFAEYPTCEYAWTTACSDRIVQGGFKYGQEAPWIVRQWGLIVGLLLAGAFIINHFVHNKGKRLDLEDGDCNA